MKWVIYGLGNPGINYKNTRHNFGRDFLGLFSNEKNENWKKFNNHGEYWKLKNNDGDEFFFLRTTTLYMNESGILLEEFIHFFDINIENIIVIYDEMDYPLGQIKIRENGSAGGHNGMKNIIKFVNTSNIKRIRLGIGRPNTDIKNYVLGKFTFNENKIVLEVMRKMNEIINFFLLDTNFSLLMNKFNA